MYKRFDEMSVELRPNLRGGDGAPAFRRVFSPDEIGRGSELFSVVTLQPGESIGRHVHDTNGEAYLILSGSATVTEDDESRVLCAGDAEFCADGHAHSIRNHTDQPMTFLALILSDQ